jgi:hypothetical protein
MVEEEGRLWQEGSSDGRGRRTAEPSKGDGRLLHACPGLRRDVRPAGPVTSIVVGPVRPSPSSHHHPRHCITIPYVVGVRSNKTPPRQLLCALRPPVSRTLESAYGRRLHRRLQHTTLEVAPGRAQGVPQRSVGSQIRQDGHPLRCNVHHTATRS